ncbi:nitrogen fixation protein NifX [Raoultella terrigena]|uniref:Nitrogen fixation protein NifX n=1 Tax=Raoultella terrigena TaxID=577 RepID=A0A4U9CWC4_RAOTE|nr:nitrogen fixation protein NifX [Raoultella terrigena]
MPPINRQFDMVHSDEWSMKVAFASSDYRHVDRHFGATPRLVVYGVKADRVTLIRVVDFTVESGHQAERIGPRIHALEDCVTLFCVAIGDAIFRQLLQVGVRAERVPADTKIVDLLQEIQLYWYAKEQRKSAAGATRSALPGCSRSRSGGRIATRGANPVVSVTNPTKNSDTVGRYCQMWILTL